MIAASQLASGDKEISDLSTDGSRDGEEYDLTKIMDADIFQIYKYLGKIFYCLKKQDINEHVYHLCCVLSEIKR